MVIRTGHAPKAAQLIINPLFPYLAAILDTAFFLLAKTSTKTVSSMNFFLFRRWKIEECPQLFQNVRLQFGSYSVIYDVENPDSRQAFPIAVVCSKLGVPFDKSLIGIPLLIFKITYQSALGI